MTTLITMDHRCILTGVLSALTILCVAGLTSGCRANRPNPSSAPTTRPVEILKKPAIDLTRGGAGFPLDLSTPPGDIAALVEAMTRAYAQRLEPNPSIRITTHGDQLNALQSLEIDLTGSTVRGDYTPKSDPKSNAKPDAKPDAKLDAKGDAKSEANASALAPFIRTKRLRYSAEPLRYQTYNASMVLEAQDAELSLSPTQNGKLLLSLSDCSQGSARLTIGRRDLQAGLAAGARLRRSLALAIEGVELSLQSESEKSLHVALLVRSRVLLFPATFRLTGRADVDADFNVHFTHLSADGRDPSGAVIAGIIQTSLDKLNNKAAPLLRLPGDKIRVSELRITLDDSLSIDMRFKGSK